MLCVNCKAKKRIKWLAKQKENYKQALKDKEQEKKDDQRRTKLQLQMGVIPTTTVELTVKQMKQKRLIKKREKLMQIYAQKSLVPIKEEVEEDGPPDNQLVAA